MGHTNDRAILKSDPTMNIFVVQHFSLTTSQSVPPQSGAGIKQNCRIGEGKAELLVNCIRGISDVDPGEKIYVKVKFEIIK